MKYLLLISVLLLQACSTVVPVGAKFPDGPGKVAMEACPALKKLPEDVVLSDVSKTVANNYTTYYECAVKMDAWIEWYQVQKNIFEKAMK